MSSIDVLSLGDMVTDTFIKLPSNQAKVIQDDQAKWLALPFGQKLPYDQAIIMEAVGNAANASVSFARLGFSSSLMSNVGDDQYGRDMIITLHKNNVDTRFVRMNAHKVSNKNFILWYKEERTILVHHEAYEYHWPHLRPQETPKWIYFSSVSQHSLGFHDDLVDWLGQHPEVNLAFQPGTYQIEFGTKRLQRLYARSNVLVMNREEAVKVSGGKGDDLHDLFNRLHDLGAKIVAITDGPAGAYAVTAPNACLCRLTRTHVHQWNVPARATPLRLLL